MPGGGVALLRAQTALDDIGAGGADAQIGTAILRRALESPIRQIAANAGAEGSIVVARVRDGQEGFGYNAQTDNYENLVTAGVIDPTKVVRIALQNAASIASLLLTTEAVVAERPEEEKPMPGGAPGGGHGRHVLGPVADRPGSSGQRRSRWVRGSVRRRGPGRVYNGASGPVSRTRVPASPRPAPASRSSAGHPSR